MTKREAYAVEQRRRALEQAMLACYEFIERFRKELASLDAARQSGTEVRE